jgi:predicted nucleic acid-binding protein
VSELIALDTNVLVYSYFEDAPQFAASDRVLKSAEWEGAGLCVADQVLAEFFATVTNAKQVSNPMTSEEAAGAVREILALPGIVPLPTPVGLAARWLELVDRHPVTRQAIFDLQLAATLIANGVHRIYTYDATHFASVPDLEIVEPGEARG